MARKSNISSGSRLDFASYVTLKTGENGMNGRDAYWNGRDFRHLVCATVGISSRCKIAEWHAALMTFVRKRKRTFSSGTHLRL